MVAGVGPEKRKRGVIAFITRADRFLLIQRAEDLVCGGAWCFPGGTIERGESPAQALVREMREEIAVEITPRDPIWCWQDAAERLQLEWWTADIVAGEPIPNPREVQRVAWMTIQTARATPNILPNNLDFLRFVERSGLLAPPQPRDHTTSDA